MAEDIEPKEGPSPTNILSSVYCLFKLLLTDNPFVIPFLDFNMENAFSALERQCSTVLASGSEQVIAQLAASQSFLCVHSVHIPLQQQFILFK